MTFSDELWAELTAAKPDYVKSTQLIQAHPELLNSINAKKNTPLLETLKSAFRFKPQDENYYNFLKFLASHKNLDLTYCNPRLLETAIKGILSTCNPEILKIFIHPDIIFSRDELSYSVFDRFISLFPAHVDKLLVMKAMIKQATLDFLPNHPKFATTSVASITATKDPEILQLFLKRPGIIFDGDKLSFQTVNKLHYETRAAYKAAVSTAPNAEATQKLKQDMDNLAIMEDKIRSATLLQAVLNDDVPLLVRLAGVGGCGSTTITEIGKSYQQLARELNKHKIIDFCDGGLKTSIEALNQSRAAMFDTVSNIARTQQQIKATTATYAQNREASLDQLEQASGVLLKSFSS